MMYLWIVIAAVAGAVGAWFFLDEFGQREMKKLRQENEQLRKQTSLLDTQKITFVEQKIELQTVQCGLHVPLRYLQDEKDLTKHLKRSLERQIGEKLLEFCNISMKVEPHMEQFTVYAKLSVATPEKQNDIHSMLQQLRAEYFRSTVIGPEQFAAGNPGAAQFVAEAYLKNALRAEEGFLKMLSIGVVGDKLYMLWNDCCDRDTALAVAVINVLPEEEILRHINYEQGRGIPFTEEEKEKLRYERCE